MTFEVRFHEKLLEIGQRIQGRSESLLRLEDELEKLTSEIARIQHEIQVDDRALKVMQSILDEQVDAREFNASVSSSGSVDHTPGSTPSSRVVKCRPVDGVIEVLRDNPEGLKASEIADKLINSMATSSQNPRNIVHNTIHALVRRHKVQKDDATSRYRLTGS